MAVSGGMDRRHFLKASGLGIAALTAAPSRALAGLDWPVVARSLESRGGFDAVKTVHDYGDVVITRYGANLDSGNFGIAPDPRTGLVYASQRVGNNVVVFDRKAERFVEVLPLPTAASGPHNIKLDTKTNSLWIASGESSRVTRLVLDRRTLRPRRFVEYEAPGRELYAKPHALVSVQGREIWYTDDRQERVGWVDVRTGKVRLVDHHIEADGIMYEPPRRRRRRRGDRGRIWVAGGKHVTVIDVARRKVLHEVEVPREAGVSQLRLHDLALDAARNRVWVLMRGGDAITWLDRDRPQTGPRGVVAPAEQIAGLDHMVKGRYLWWTEGRSNHITRHDPSTNETRGYKVPVPVGYFNPHGLALAPRWREVWFTEREALCRVRFKDGRQI